MYRCAWCRAEIPHPTRGGHNQRFCPTCRPKAKSVNRWLSDRGHTLRQARYVMAHPNQYPKDQAWAREVVAKERRAGSRKPRGKLIQGLLLEWIERGS